MDVSVTQKHDYFYVVLEDNSLMLYVSLAIAVFLGISVGMYHKRLIAAMNKLGYTNVITANCDIVFEHIVGEKEKEKIIEAFKEEFAPELTMISLK